MTQDQRREFLIDLLPIVPSFQDCNMIDWMILALWVCTFLLPPKTVPGRLLAISTVELLWGLYDLSIGEYAQAIPFLIQFLMILSISVKRHQEAQ